MADETLSDLGPVPSDIEALIERYIGKRRVTAAQADALLGELGGTAATALSSQAAAASELRPRRRYNTPFPQGIAGADELPELRAGRGLRTPLPGFHFAARPAVPSVPPPEPAVVTAAVTPAPDPQPMAASADADPSEDSFEILVDDEVLELEPDDLLVVDAGDDDAES